MKANDRVLLTFSQKLYNHTISAFKLNFRRIPLLWSSESGVGREGYDSHWTRETGHAGGNLMLGYPHKVTSLHESVSSSRPSGSCNHKND